MLDFRKNSSSPNQRDSKQRQRLFVLVLMLGIVLVLIGWARSPAHWRWFDLLATPSQELSAVTAIDNRLDAERQPDTDIAWKVPATSLEERHGMGTGQNDADRPHPNPLPEGEGTNEKPLPEGEGTNEKPLPEGEGAHGAYFPGVTAEPFEEVRDDTPSRREEQAVSLRLFDVLNRADPAMIQQSSLGPITYAQLFQQPNLYRGRLVSVAGIVRRVNRLKLFPNDYGIKGYYQVWLWPADNPTAPIVIYCLDLPEGFPTGMEIAEQAEATGFFFKRWAYQAKDAIRTAPEILAKTLHWDKRPNMDPAAPAETWPIPLVVCAAVLAALAAAYVVYLRTRPIGPTLPEQAPDFDHLQQGQPEEGTTDGHG